MRRRTRGVESGTTISGAWQRLRNMRSSCVVRNALFSRTRTSLAGGEGVRLHKPRFANDGAWQREGVQRRPLRPFSHAAAVRS
eukprot:677214-Pleurochrysis_carterae.AAC.1